VCRGKGRAAPTGLEKQAFRRSHEGRRLRRSAAAASHLGRAKAHGSDPIKAGELFSMEGNQLALATRGFDVSTFERAEVYRT
jgi:hypothetical protein